MPGDHHGFIPSSAEDLLRRRVKQELRKRMRGLRKAMPASACQERSARIVERLEALEAIAKARSVALFWPMEERREVDLRELDARLRRRGARVAYPAVMEGVGGEEGRSLVFRFAREGCPMVDGPYGVGEPADTEPVAAPGDIDAMVVPSLAVDPRGHRIGYGAGYYDRALARYAPPAVTVAVAYDFQLLAEIPNTDGDVAVAWVVTDARASAAEGAR